ncbi:MAG: bifunctional diguanylate cyclase/phosphodiesterase [Thiobacillus sp.]
MFENQINPYKDGNKTGNSGKWTMTLRIRLMLLVLIATLPALAVIVDTAIDQHRHLKADAQQSALTFARFAVNYHGSRVAETQRLLNLMAEMPQVRELKTQDCNTLLEELLFGNLNYANFGVIRTNGDVACSGVRPDAPVNLADRAYFQAAMQTRRLSVGDYQVGRFVKKPVLVIAQPLLNAEQQVQSVVYAALNLDWLRQFLPLSELPPGSAVTVIDRHGVILARAPDPKGHWTGVNLEKDVPIAGQFIASKLGETIKEGRGVDGVQRIYALASLDSSSDSHGYIMVGIPSGELDAALNAELLPRIAFFSATFLAIMLLAWFGSEALILKRTRILTTSTRQMGRGDFSARARIRGNDEIAHLAAEFNQMGETLQKDHGQIQRLSRIHAVLSGINGAIMRIRERDALLREACQIAVQRGELRFAWIGLIDAATGKLEKSAWHGEGEGYLHDLCVGAASERYPCTVAALEDRPVIHNEVGHEQAHAPWLGQALAYGFRSVAIFPLRREGHVIGILGLYADEAHFFEAPETDLFLELAADISLGLEYIDKDQRIAHMLYHDSLTGLPNRKLCEDRLQQAIARAKPHHRYVGAIVVNITGFRRVVGIYGNHVADETLNIVAKHLLGQVREGDTVARLEGDEFAIVLSDMASIQDAIRLARFLVSAIPSVVHCAEQDIHLVMRGGVAIYPGDGEDATSLLGNATLACTSRKDAGLHSVNFYSSDIQQVAKEREQLEQALRHAIAEDRELELHYQPVVDIVSHRIVSLEALARWNSPEFGAVSPMRFIPVAEQSGLIMPLGDWVLRTACRQIDAWRELGLNEIRVTINVSFHQLRDADFIERLCSTANATTPQGQNQLAIELTESELMDNIEMTIAQLEILKERNFTIYIDDFGTGYSSLSYLQKLPVHVLKIDQSFVGMLGKSESSAAIVRAIIALAQSLKLKTIAEGVETPEQLALLHQLGCDYAQGYLFSKPRPAAEITGLLKIGTLAPEGFGHTEGVTC